VSDKIKRLSAIIKVIANNPGITLTGLKTQLPEYGIKVTERTLAKDILVLKHEYSLLPDKERLRSGYVLEDIITLAETEMSLVLDALHMLSARMDDPEAHEVLQRLTELNNQRGQTADSAQRIRTVRQRNIMKSKDRAETNRILKEAIRTRQAVRYVYNTPRVGKDETANGFPLLMVFHERGWYCITRDVKEKTYYPRRIDRIKELKIVESHGTNQDFEENFREANYLMNCGWGMTFPRSMKLLEEAEQQPPIVARFNRVIAPYILEAVERHPKGKVLPVKDGTGDVEFSIKLTDAKEFIHWIRSFGARARIISPPSMVEQERSEIRRMYEAYQADTK
jgi:predicted DNA-binding transcriptional regulator YafY